MLGSTSRRGGDHVDGSSTGTAEIAVRAVLQVLVGRVGVDRGHQAALDAEGVIDNLGQRAEAVGSAGRVGDDVVRCGIVEVLVDAHDDGDVFVAGRCRNEDLLGAGVNVLLGGCCLVKKPVDSMTMSTPSSPPQGRLAGSRSASTVMDLPSTTRLPSTTSTDCVRRPPTESYFRRWARVSGW